MLRFKDCQIIMLQELQAFLEDTVILLLNLTSSLF